jgi:hypothetical protein
MTGVIIAIREELLGKGTTKKWASLAGRILTVRLKTQFVDVSIVGAYAPGEHLPKVQKAEFWKLLTRTLKEIPRRSVRILGIDGDGHIGRDPSGVGSAGQERGTSNGLEIDKLFIVGQLTALNTLQSCQDPGWTWQKRNGTGRGRIDYIIVDKKQLGLIKKNHGAIDAAKWGIMGSATDHRPVMATMRIKTLQEMGKHQFEEVKTQSHKMTQSNESLCKLYDAHFISVENECRMEKQPVDPDAMCLLRELQSKVAHNIEQHWSADLSVDEMQQLIDNTLQDAYHENLCQQKSQKEKKKRKTPSHRKLGKRYRKNKSVGKKSADGGEQQELSSGNQR